MNCDKPKSEKNGDNTLDVAKPAQMINSVPSPLVQAKAPAPKPAERKSEARSKSNLSGRKDVVYKTLLRSIKRYYTTLFEEQTDYASLSKSKQDKLCTKIIDQFVRRVFAHHLSQAVTENGEKVDVINKVAVDLISSFILSLVIPSYVKRNCKGTKTFEIYETFYECLYRYSHKRLETALGIQAVAAVFKIFLEGDVFEELVTTDDTLSKNQDAYRVAKAEFLDIVNKA